MPARARSIAVLLLLVACGGRATPSQIAPPNVDPPRSAAPSHETDAAGGSSPVLDATIAEMRDVCAPAAEGASDAPRVEDRRVDLDGDGRDEAIVNVMCADVSQWKVLAEQGGEAIVLREEFADATYDVVRGPNGAPLLVVQHDCCCIYELSVHALERGALVERFAWGAGCSAGCDASFDIATDTGYAARVDLTNGVLGGISLPTGACGADGSVAVDLTTWKAPDVSG